MAALATGLGAWASSRVLARTGGNLAVPLDDAYIHFQFARAFARLEPLVYVAGEPPVAGATSLSWPLVLAPAALLDDWLGTGAATLIATGWMLGFLALAGLAHEAFRLCEPLCNRAAAWLSALMVLAFGGHVWCAGSGMEVVPFAFALARTTRLSAEAWEGQPRFRELLIWAWVTPLLRPEGVLASALAAAALAAASPRKRRALGALAGVLGPPLFCLVFAGTATTTTSVVKWLPLNPYLTPADVVARVGSHVQLLASTLLDGRLWSSTALPAGAAPVAWLALPAVVIAGFVQGRRARALNVVVLGLGMLLPATYETFLVNRLRYLWPFASAWLVGVAALAWLLGLLGALAVQRLAPRALPRDLSLVRLVVTSGLGAGALALLAERLPAAIDDLSESAFAIDAQQVALARWAHAELPPDARLAVNDAGALSYFSRRRTLDVVGLTTAGQGPHWVAGPGSCFERFERMAPSQLPSHFIVYPEWLALDPLLGEELTERTVHATILGGTTMRAHVADFRLLGSGARPLAERWARLRPVDELDVADLESEKAHEYDLTGTTREGNFLSTHEGLADGARAGRRRERFVLKVERGGVVVARWSTAEPGRVTVSFDGHAVTAQVTAALWLEVGFAVPDPSFESSSEASRSVLVDVASTTELTALHYWSLAAEGAAPTAERSGASVAAPTDAAAP